MNIKMFKTKNFYLLIKRLEIKYPTYIISGNYNKISNTGNIIFHLKSDLSIKIEYNIFYSNIEHKFLLFNSNSGKKIKNPQYSKILGKLK